MADTRQPWPAPPATRAQAPGAGEPPLSDTLERMLRPQGLFQNPPPKPFDWQQTWAAPAIAAGGPTPPPGMESTMPHPAPTPGEGQWQAPNGGAYPPGNQYQTSVLLQPGGPTPPPGASYPADGTASPGTGAYPPGQYEQGQFGPGQYPNAQYGPDGQYRQYGQYGPGGQVPGDQLGHGPLPPAQYGPDGQYRQYGQFGSGGGPFGPGQYGPDGMPLTGGRPPRKLGGITLPRGPVVPAIVAVVLILIVVVAVLLSAKGNSSPGQASGKTGATASATPTAKSSASSPNPAERQAAAKLSGLLSQSGTDRAEVNAAYSNVQACGKDLASDARVFDRAADNRHTLLAKLSSLQGRSALSAAMVGDLTAAWQASATVDTDLGKWASTAAGHCHRGNSSDPSLAASAPYDSQATNNKQAFARLWNRLARKDSLPAYTVTQL